jgi:hypothetical protein
MGKDWHDLDELTLPSLDFEDLPEELKSTIDFTCLSEGSFTGSELYQTIYSIADPKARAQAKAIALAAARKCHMVRPFQQQCKAYEQPGEAPGRSGNVTDFAGAAVSLRCGAWTANDSGIGRMVTRGQSQVYEDACRHPILPVERLVNIETGLEKVRLRFMAAGRWKDALFDREVISSTRHITVLANYGISVNSETARPLMLYLSDCLNLNPDTIPVIRTVSALGWVDECRAFVPYSDDVRFDGENDCRHIFKAVSARDELQPWIDYMRRLRQDNKLLRIIMAASFASPLIELAGALPFILHIWGGPLTSGSGKTVGLMCAASIWGNPELGQLTTTLDKTLNALMSYAATLKDIPFCGDELQLIRAYEDNYDKLIMRMCEGVNRGRMKYNQQLPTQNWKCATITTGEEPIIKANSGAGAHSRVIQIECEQMVVNNGPEVSAFIKSHYGQAGRAYIEGLKNYDIVEIYRTAYAATLKACNTNEKQAMAMALLITGDCLAEEILFKSGQKLGVGDLRGYAFTPEEIDISERAYQWTTSWILQNAVRFKPIGDNNRGEVWGKESQDKQEVRVLQTVLEKAMAKEGFDFNAVKKKWAQKGYNRMDGGRYNVWRSDCGHRISWIAFQMNLLECEQRAFGQLDGEEIEDGTQA